MDADIRAVLEAAIQAPSAENLQPWRFRINSRIIELHHDSSNDDDIHDSGNRAAFVAHGAALENIFISSKALGYSPKINLFPNRNKKDFVALIELGEKGIIDQESTELIEVVSSRATNRNRYRKTPLSSEVSELLIDIVRESSKISYVRLTNPKQIQTCATVGGSNEEIMLQNRLMHDFFFNRVTWTAEENNKKRIGFYIKTLGLPPPIQSLFKIIRNWSAMSPLVKIGFPSFVGKSNAATYASAAEIGILSTKSDTPEGFIETGRILQRIWLLATCKDVSLQPLAGIIFMNFYLIDNPADSRAFTLHEQEIIRNSMSELQTILHNNDVITFMFRLGYGKPAEARALRFPLEHFML